jgi:ATP-dependent exoDNAse (exonuclease V) beta subunit
MAKALNDDLLEMAYYTKGSDEPNHSGHGECLHHMFEHYIKALRINPKLNRDNAFKCAHKALHKFFKRENRKGFLRIQKYATRPNMWTVAEIKAWALKCLRRFIKWLKDEQIVFIEEEMSLAFELDLPDGSVRGFNLGRSDLVAYSAKTGRYIVIDHKTSQKQLDEELKSSVKRQLLKHALGLHLYFKKKKPPVHLLEVETVALFFVVGRGRLEFKPRFNQVHNPFELFRRNGEKWKRLQTRYKPLVKNFSRARYVPAKS